MPNFDGTGPLGNGPYTGRGDGFCIFKKDATNRWYGFAGNKMHPQEFRQTKSRKKAMKMPGGDRTEPQGLGPMTGRQRGAVEYPINAPYAPPYCGVAYPYSPGINKEQQVDILNRQAEYFENALDDICKQIDDLEAQAQESQ